MIATKLQYVKSIIMKPKVNIKLTSSQSFFENREYNLWKNDNAPILVGIGIRAPENIGAMIRLAGNVGCRKVIFVDNEESHNTRKIKKVATTAYNKVDWRFEIIDNWKKLIPDGYKFIAMETTPDSELIYDISWPLKTVLVVGDERYGIDEDTLNECEKKAYIPMVGSVKSLNVVQAASIGLFELVRTKMKS
jgi:tRNA G18 (ribose-2'-O)-methylase SpoU